MTKLHDLTVLGVPTWADIKGSRKWERRGVRIVANVRYQVSDRGDRYLFTFWTCRFCVQIQFPFPFVITKWIGDYFDNRLCAANFGASIYSRVTNMIDLFCPQMAMRIKFGAPFFNHILSRGIVSCSGRVSIYAPNIRYANKLALCE
jgi:hypothetical protein